MLMVYQAYLLIGYSYSPFFGAKLTSLQSSFDKKVIGNTISYLKYLFSKWWDCLSKSASHWVGKCEIFSKNFWRARCVSSDGKSFVWQLQILLALLTVLGVIFYRLAVRVTLAAWEGAGGDVLKKNSSLIVACTAASINLCIIFTLNFVSFVIWDLSYHLFDSAILE